MFVDDLTFDNEKKYLASKGIVLNVTTDNMKETEDMICLGNFFAHRELAEALPGGTNLPEVRICADKFAKGGSGITF